MRGAANTRRAALLAIGAACVGCDALLGLNDPREGRDGGTSTPLGQEAAEAGPAQHVGGDAGVDAAAAAIVGVTGSFRQARLTSTGETSLPLDFQATHVVLAALVPNPSAPDGYDHYPAQQNADGTFAIPGVPPGPYYFSYERSRPGQTHPGIGQLIETDQHVLTLVQDILGHGPTDAGAPSSGPGSVRFDVTSLAPWVPSSDTSQQFADDLYLTNFNAGLQVDVMTTPEALAPPIPNGATSLETTYNFPDGVGYDAFALGKRPVEAAVDGPSTLAQVHVQDAGIPGSVYRSLDRVAVAALDVAPGKDSVFQTQFVPVTKRRSFDVVWRHGEFAKWLAAASPKVVDGGQFASVTAQPGGGTRDFYGPLLLEYDVPATETDERVTLAFGYPYPDQWTSMLMAGVALSVPQTLPAGGTPGMVQWGYIACFYDVDLVQPSFTIEPGVSPPRAPKVNGRDAYQDQQGVGAEPTFTWDPPEMGIPTVYGINIYDADLAHYSVRYAETTATSFRVPKGMLESGHSYQITIDAMIVGPRRSPQNILDGARLPSCQASAMLGLISP